MAKNRRKIDAAVQERLGEVAAELRRIIYGEHRGVQNGGRSSHRLRTRGWLSGSNWPVC